MRNSINDDDDTFDCRVLKHLPGLSLSQLIVGFCSLSRCCLIICNRLVDSYVDLEDSEEEEEEESNLEIGCPYCLEGFDAIGLCVHLEDQHPLEIKLGVIGFIDLFLSNLLSIL